MKKALIFVLVLIIGLALSFVDYTPKRDYTNLTQGVLPFEDIAIDIEKEYKDDYIRLLWELGKNSLTYKKRGL